MKHNERTYKLTFNGITLDTTKLRMNKRGGKEVIDYFQLDDNHRIEDENITDAASLRKAIEDGGDECRAMKIDGDKTVVEVTLDLEPIHKPDPPTLECMSSSVDGSKWGLGDWYLEIEVGILAALNQGPEHEWTTGWYASKKEIASGRITNTGGGIKVEASVSDDFDTPGLGERIVEHTTDLGKIREAICEAWDEAGENQKDNREYVGFSILTGVDQARRCVETYIACTSDYPGDGPPGDCYHQWGFQEEHDVPEKTKEKLAEWAERWTYQRDGESLTVDGFTIKPWEDK